MLEVRYVCNIMFPKNSVKKVDRYECYIYHRLVVNASIFLGHVLMRIYLYVLKAERKQYKQNLQWLCLWRCSPRPLLENQNWGLMNATVTW